MHERPVKIKNQNPIFHVFKHTQNVQRQINPKRKANAPELPLTQLWKHFPFARSHIRPNGWTIQEDIVLLKIYADIKVERGKLSIIDKLLPTRSTSALPKRLKLIVDCLKNQHPQWKYQSYTTVIARYLTQLDREGFDLETIVIQTLKKINTYEVLKTQVYNSDYEVNPIGSQTEQSRRKDNQEIRDEENYKKFDKLENKPEQQLVKKQYIQNECHRIYQHYEHCLSSQFAQMNKGYDQMMKSVTTISNLVGLAQKMLKRRKISQINTNQNIY